MRNMGYYLRWAMLLASGAVVFEAGSCWDVAQTGLLALIGGATFFLAQNV